MRIWFRCGHDVAIDPDKATEPRCAQCGDRHVARVQLHRLPRIVGHATGPLVETRELGPTAVDLKART